ncbi:HNH endonuclease [Lysinibacillus sp. RSDA_15]|uniref:HNH endonuclease n=1 Tax=Lysinibacillus sp. RSDA_15 TaxID=3391421 RepID=UPI003A4E2A8D
MKLVKKINLNSRFIISHLKYCKGLYVETLHKGMHKFEFSENGEGTYYLKKRPFGKILNYIKRDYPQDYIGIKTLDQTYEVRKRIANFLKNSFNKIITSKPEELLEIERVLYYDICKVETEEQSKNLNLFLEYIFNYESFSGEDYSKCEWSAYKYIKSLGVSICVYCNSQFTHTIYKELGDAKSFKVRPALDHIFPKSSHPLLSVSIYNLVPSCNTCNSSLKGADEVSIEEFIHPYLEDINEIGVFTREFEKGNKDYYSQIVGKDYSYNIKFISRDIKNIDKVKAYEEMFGIDYRYELHKSYLNKQIVLALIYNEVYLNRLQISFDKVAFDPKLIKDILFTTDINNSILSKLVVDVLSEVKQAKNFIDSTQMLMLKEYLKEEEY